MKQKILLLYKPISITPLELIEKFRVENPKYKNEKLGYAGRLDPMAQGLMLVLVGEENKKKAKYEKLDKIYEFSVLFGVKTDTYDVLGIPQKNQYHSWSVMDGQKLNKYLKTLPGIKLQEYPPYSSRTVNGVPLFRWARDGKLSKIKIPVHKVEIKSIKLLRTSHISSADLLREIERRISPLDGDFRQDEILEDWQKILTIKAVFTVKSFRVSCSSGTYVRSIAQEMGKSINKESLALQIRRIAIGDYTLESGDVLSNKKPA